MQSNSDKTMHDSYLHINCCGCEFIGESGGGSLRPNGRYDYQILYIANGECKVYLNNEKIIVPKGSVIVYLPYQRQEYYFSGKIDTTSYYIHFTGSACADLIKKFGMANENIYNIGYDHSIINLWDNLIDTSRLKLAYYDENCQGLLLCILSKIAHRIFNNTLSTNYNSIKQIKQICLDIYSNYSCEHSIKEYAKKCNLSESRFSHAFKEITGISPKQYIINAKIEMSQELLKNPGLSVSQIAHNTGFHDQSYFSRIFKKYTGQSPTQYRDDLFQADFEHF